MEMNKNNFYDSFIRFCNQFKKSPSSVALECGLSKSAVTGWKNGKQPNDATVQQIADYFGVSGDDLLCTPGIDESGSVIPATDDQMKAAFWHGETVLDSEDIDDLWEDVRAYVQMQTQLRRKKKQNDRKGTL